MEKNVYVEIRPVDATGVLNEPVICERDKANAHGVYICTSEDRVTIRRQWVMHDKLYCVAEGVAGRISNALDVSVSIAPDVLECYNKQMNAENAHDTTV